MSETGPAGRRGGSNLELVAAVSEAGGSGLLTTIVAPDVDFVLDPARRGKVFTDRASASRPPLTSVMAQRPRSP